LGLAKGSFYRYFESKKTLYAEVPHIDFRENIRTGKPLYSLPDKEMLSIAKKFIDILYNGTTLK
jgi:AcrR family transcriptional regulator